METVGFFDAEILKFPEASPPGKLRVETEGKQNSLFSSNLSFLIPPNSKRKQNLRKKTKRKKFAWRWLTHKFSSASRCHEWMGSLVTLLKPLRSFKVQDQIKSRASQKLKFVVRKLVSFVCPRRCNEFWSMTCEKFSSNRKNAYLSWETKWCQ